VELRCDAEAIGPPDPAPCGLVSLACQKRGVEVSDMSIPGVLRAAGAAGAPGEVLGAGRGAVRDDREVAAVFDELPAKVGAYRLFE